MEFSVLLYVFLSIASVSAKVFNVSVGENEQLAFNPPCISGAVAGDQVVFKFISKNHTVTQSTFGSPCTKENTTAFDSGFNPANATSQPTFTITLNAQTASVPQWFYCKQKIPVSHCHKGMVFAINPTANKTFAQFQQNAINDANNTSTTGAPCTTTAPSATSTSPPSPSAWNSTSNGSTGKVHSILVGANSTLTFSPPSIQAMAGDTIDFTFLSKNHSATQSTFANPCTLAPGGVNSGFQPVSANSSMTMQWSITLDAKSASSPLWFFCAQTNPANHCHAGMVFAINANANKTFEQFKANAMNSSAPSSGANSSTTTGGYGNSGPYGGSGSYGGSGGASMPPSSPAAASATTSANPSVNINAPSNGELRSSVNTVALMAIVGLVASLGL